MELSQNRAVGRAQRRKGLAGIGIDMAPEELIFENCHSIHTFGMRFNLLVIFLDRDNRVLKSKIAKPRRIFFGPPGTYTTVERPVR